MGALKSDDFLRKVVKKCEIPAKSVKKWLGFRVVFVSFVDFWLKSWKKLKNFQNKRGKIRVVFATNCICDTYSDLQAVNSAVAINFLT